MMLSFIICGLLPSDRALQVTTFITAVAYITSGYGFLACCGAGQLPGHLVAPITCSTRIEYRHVQLPITLKLDFQPVGCAARLSRAVCIVDEGVRQKLTRKS